MIALVLSILSSTIIALVFKIIDIQKIKLFPVIVINYIAATFLGFVINSSEINLSQIVHFNWFFSALGIGVFLILGFYLIGYSTAKVGIAITTISNKMSVVLPILLSIFVFSDKLSELKILGIVIALISVFFTVYKKRSKKFDFKLFYLPVFLFFTIGIIDSLVKYSQSELNETQIPVFTAISFGISGIMGIILSFFNSTKFRDFFSKKVLFAGIIIGATNFGSMFFVIRALNYSGLASSVVFGVNNIGIISLSVLIAFFVFKEKLKLVNWIGIALSIIAAFILAVL